MVTSQIHNHLFPFCSSARAGMMKDPLKVGDHADDVTLR